MVRSKESKNVTERCDTEELFFLFTADGRPFFLARQLLGRSQHYLNVVRRRVVGCSLEVRAGNYAAATIDEMLSAWGSDPLIHAADDGSFVHIAPHDYLEG